jgi:hypothetical protein
MLSNIGLLDDFRLGNRKGCPYGWGLPCINNCLKYKIISQGVVVGLFLF